MSPRRMRTGSRQAPRCVAPLGDVPDVAPGEAPRATLCGRPATEEREVEGYAVPLCAEHAAELDEEREHGEEPGSEN